MGLYALVQKILTDEKPISFTDEHGQPFTLTIETVEEDVDE